MISSDAPADVHVRGVDQGAAGLDEAVELRVDAGLVGLRAEGHGAERERGHRAAAVAKGSVVHGQQPMARSVGRTVGTGWEGVPMIAHPSPLTDDPVGHNVDALWHRPGE